MHVLLFSPDTTLISRIFTLNLWLHEDSLREMVKENITYYKNMTTITKGGNTKWALTENMTRKSMTSLPGSTLQRHSSRERLCLVTDAYHTSPHLWFSKKKKKDGQSLIPTPTQIWLKSIQNRGLTVTIFHFLTGLPAAKMTDRAHFLASK